MVTLYNADGTTFIELNVSDQSYCYRAIMSDSTVTLYYSLPEHVEVPLGTYMMYEGWKYTLNQPENFKKNGIRKFDYTLILNSEQYQLTKYKLRNNVPGDRRLKFSYTARPEEFLQLIVDNLNERDSGWAVGLPTVDAVETVVTFNHNSCRDALQLIANAFETEWEVVNKTIFLKRVEYNKGNPYPLSYGRGNGFKPGVGRMNYNNTRPVEVLFVEGGNRNIDYTTYGNAELLLPKNYSIGFDGEHFSDEPDYNPERARQYITDDEGFSVRRSDKAPETREEDSLDCTNIYPMREGTVTAVEQQGNIWTFTDTTIPEELNYADYRIPGEVATVVFQSGMLAGKEFDIIQTETALTGYIHSERRFRLVSQEIDGQLMPNDVFKMEPGDKYGVFNISMPDDYIEQAEINMLKQAVMYLYENEVPQFTFTGELDGIWAASQWDTLRLYIEVGGYIDFSDAQFHPEPTPTRITGLKTYINRPHYPVIELSNGPISGSLHTTLRKLETEEVLSEERTNGAINFTKRRYQHARELIGLLEGAIEGFSEGINPVTVETMAILLGSENLQYRFVVAPDNPTAVTHTWNYDPATKIFSTDYGYIQHMTLGIDAISNEHQPTEYRYFFMEPFTSVPLTDAKTAYYGYIKIADDNNGDFYFSTTPQPFRTGDELFPYNFLVGILSSEVDGERSFAPLYGFTQILPGQITTDMIRSADGDTYFDLVNNVIGGRINFVDGLISGLIGVADSNGNINAGLNGSSGDNPVRIWAGDDEENIDDAPYRLYDDGSFVAQMATIIGLIQSNESGTRFVLDPVTRTWRMYDATNNIRAEWSYDSTRGSVITIYGSDNLVMDSTGITLSDVQITPTAIVVGAVGKRLLVSSSETIMDIRMQGLPTSSEGLLSGSLWRNGNSLMIVP